MPAEFTHLSSEIIFSFCHTDGVLYTQGVLLFCRLLKIRAKALNYSDTCSVAIAVLFIHKAFCVQLLVRSECACWVYTITHNSHFCTHLKSFRMLYCDVLCTLYIDQQKAGLPYVSPSSTTLASSTRTSLISLVTLPPASSSSPLTRRSSLHCRKCRREL